MTSVGLFVIVQAGRGSPAGGALASAAIASVQPSADRATPAPVLTPLGATPTSGIASGSPAPSSAASSPTSPPGFASASPSALAATTPTVTAVGPTSGAIVGGTRVILSGTGFVAGATVTVGGAPAAAVSVSSATSLTAITPAHIAGSVAVTVSNPDARSGSCDCFTYDMPDPVAFPLVVSEDGRSLRDQNGAPFRIHGDSGWSMISNLTFAEAETYLNDRRARGFNTVIAELVEHKFAVNAPANRSGDQPFTNPGDLSTPNEAYFAHADAVIALAASKGMLVMLSYLYLGYAGGDEGWWGEINGTANSRAVCYAFGQYLGNRFAGRSNIVWIAGGDYVPPANSEGEGRARRVLEGIESVSGASRLVSGHWSSSMVSTDEPAFAGAITLNGAYARPQPYLQTQRAYAARSGPAFLLEAVYENEGSPEPGDPAAIRSYEYGAELFGIGGVLYGQRDVWAFATDTWWSGFSYGHRRWQLSLATPGAQDMTRMGQLFDSVTWWTLVPSNTSGMRRLVVSGGGAYGNADYVTAAATPDGTVLLVYLPPTGTASTTISVDLAAMSRSARARWFDPTTGIYRLIASGLPNRGPMTFTTPGSNSAGANDWVLIIDR